MVITIPIMCDSNMNWTTTPITKVAVEWMAELKQKQMLTFTHEKNIMKNLDNYKYAIS